MKKSFAIICLTLATISGFTQGNSDNWKTNGNTPQQGSFLGTLGNTPLNFRVNNVQKMILDANGDLSLSNLAGIGSRVLLTDANGKMLSLPAGSPGQFLQSNGTWASLPGGATSWSVSGNDLFSTITGNIGIGTSSPAYKLDIIGSVRISSDLTVGGGIITTQTVNANGELNGGDVNVANTLSVGGISTFNNSIYLPNNLYFGGQGSNRGISYQPPIGNNPPLIDIGNVGVGQLDPEALCYGLNTPPPPPLITQFGGELRVYHIVPPANTHPTGTPLLKIGGNATTSYLESQSSALTINKGCKNYIYLMGTRVGFGTEAPSTKFHFSNGNFLLDELNASGSDFRMTVKSGSQPGILLTTEHTDAIVVQDANNANLTNFKVKTNGNVYAREVIVTLNAFPDYVFASDYVLPNLSQVRAHIQKNHRLINMPSAKQIEKEGASIGEIQKITVEKLEEAYLYILQLEEKIEILNKKMESLEKNNK